MVSVACPLYLSETVPVECVLSTGPVFVCNLSLPECDLIYIWAKYSVGFAVPWLPLVSV